MQYFSDFHSFLLISSLKVQLQVNLLERMLFDCACKRNLKAICQLFNSTTALQVFSDNYSWKPLQLCNCCFAVIFICNIFCGDCGDFKCKCAFFLFHTNWMPFELSELIFSAGGKFISSVTSLFKSKIPSIFAQKCIFSHMHTTNRFSDYILCAFV